MENCRKPSGGVRLLALVLLLGLWGATAQATKVKVKSTSLDSLAFKDPGLRFTPQIELDHGLVRSFANPATLEAFDRLMTVERVEWDLGFDRASGVPNYMGGKGIPWIPGSGQDNAISGLDLGLPAEFAGKDIPLSVVEARARAFIDSYSDLFGAPSSDLILNREGSGPVLDYLYYLNFDFTYCGLPVENARVVFTINHGNLIEVGQEYISPEIKQLDPKPSFSEDTAWQIAWGFLGQTEPGKDDRLLGPAKLIVVPVSSDALLSGLPVDPGKGLKYRLVYSLSFHRDGVVGNWETRVDAHTGEVISFVDINAYGNIRGGTYKTDKPFNEVVTPFPFADYGPTSWSDQGGNFVGTTGTSTMTGRTGSAGNVGSVDIVDNCGAISMAADGSGIINFGTSSGLDCTTPGTGGAGNTHAARTQYWNVAQIKIKAYTYLPTNTWLQGRLTDNVNGSATTCNAYWNGSSVNFFRSGGGCWNTGELPGVSLHEWAHGMDSNDGNGSSPDGGTGETYGDFTGTLQTHSSCMGNGFLGTNCSGYGDECTSCSGVRDIDWAKHASNSPYVASQLDDTAGFGCTTDSCAGPCGYECHCESLISSQALWDLATRDLITWGLDQATAWQLVDRLWYASRPTATGAYSCPTIATTSGCATGTLWRVFRTADDDDGNPANGTPHSTALFAAFNRHLIACTTDTAYNTDSTACPSVGGTVVTATPATNTVYVNWYAATNAATYSVYRNESGCDQGYTKIATVTAPTVTYTDTVVVNGVTYYYRIQPVGTDTDCVGPMSPCSSATPLTCTPPAAPASVTATPNGTYRIDVSWAAVGGITYYNLYKSSTSGGPWTLLATTSSSTTSYSDTAVYGGRTYYYMVRSYATCESLNSVQASATAGGTCNIPPTFAGLASAANGLNATCRVDLAWSAATSNCGGAITYSVYRSRYPDFVPSTANRIATGLSGTTYQDQGGTFKMIYYYIVRAFDSVNGLDDGNTVRRSAYPSGARTTIYSNTFESDWTNWTNGSILTPLATGPVTGIWTRGDPVGTINNFGTAGQPETGANGSTNCLFTAQNSAAGVDDIDYGEVWVRSPVFSGTGYPSVEVNLYRWWLNDNTQTVSGCIYEDGCALEISNNGTTYTTLEYFPETCSTERDCGTNQWTNVKFLLEDYVSLTGTMYFRMRGWDGQNTPNGTGVCAGNLNEAALDDFYVYGYATCTACTAPPAPVLTSVTPNGSNRIDLAWTGLATTYSVFRSEGSCPGSTWVQVGGNISGTSFSDTTVSGGITYAYLVRGYSTTYCESAASACTSATATGTCSLPPIFAGVASVQSSHSATCGITLTWSAATLKCGTGVVYNIYRSTSSSFVPGDSTRIKKAATGTSYGDTAGLVYGTVYYYIVRAEDNTTGGTGPNGGNEDTNLVCLGAGPSGGEIIGGTIFSDNFDSGTGTRGWSTGYFAGDDAECIGVYACTPTHSGANIFRWGGGSCINSYTGSVASLLAPQPNVYGLDIPYDATNVRLSFWHRYVFAANDGAMLLIQKQPTAIYNFVPTAAVTGHPYNGTTGANNPIGASIPCWVGSYNTTFYNTIVDLDAACIGVDGEPCAGSTIQIAFTGSADTDATYALGWFIDDVVVTADYGATSCTTGGCSMTVEVTPVSKTADSGQDIVFTASHTQTGGPYTYQWTENGTNIGGAVLSTLAVNKSTAGSFTYNCKVTDASGLCANIQDSVSATGTWAPPCMTVDVTPNGTTTVSAGSSITFTATRTGGTAPYTYQWTENGSNIAGATTSVYAATKAVGGTFSYNCKISDSSGTCTDRVDSTPSVGTWTAPTIVYSAHGAFTEVDGNGNGIMEAGEKWSVNVTLANTGTASAANVQASLSGMAAGNGITVCNNPGTFGTIAAAGTANYTYTFVVSTAVWYGTYTCGTGLTFNIVSKSTTTLGCTCSDEMGAFSNPVGQSGMPPTLFASDDEPFTSGKWTFTSATSQTATHCARTTTYARLAQDAYMTLNSGQVSTVGYDTVQVVFDWVSFNYETDGTDYLQLQYWDGSAWQASGWSSYNATWQCGQAVTLPVGALDVADFQIRFFANGNAGNGNEQAGVDYVSIVGTSTTICNAWTATCSAGCAMTVDVTPNGTTTACTGSNITFTATQTGGTGTITYQWTENGTDITGATNSTYVVTKAAAGSFTYNCKVDATDCTDIQDATASIGTWVAPPTSVTVTPSGTTTVCTGANIIFTATVVGGATPVYQWTENGTNIAGATNSTYTATKAAAGSFNYTCIVNNTGCATTVTDATPSTGTWVAPPTSVTVTPSGTTTVCTGVNIIFTATVVGGATPLYQWTENGSNIAGATNSTYTASKAAAGSFNYTCIVNNTGCATTVTDATPSTGTWVAPPTSVTVTPSGTTTVCTGANIVFTATVVGGATPLYQWTENGTNIAGATNSTYTANKAAAGSFNYTCRVNNTGCATVVTDATPSIGTWVAPPTSVTVTPSGTTAVCTGTNIVLTATVVGGATPLYQWTENGTNIAGATNSTCTANKAAAGSFNYTCIVNNTGCATTVTDATPSTGTWVAPPTSVDVTPNGTTTLCVGANVVFTATVTGGTTPLYQWTENGSDIAGATNSTHMAVKPFAGSFIYNCRVNNAGCATGMADATASSGSWVAPPTVDVTPNGTTQVTIGNPITFTATASAGTAPYTYQWTRDGGDIAGATNSTLTESYGTVQTHTYNCKVASTGCATVAQDATASTGDWISGGTAPAEVPSQTWADTVTQSWDTVATATGYKLQRGQLADLTELLTANNDSCNRYNGAATSINTLTEDPTTLSAGDFFWYLVIAYNGSGDGPAGDATTGPRIVNNSGNCP